MTEMQVTVMTEHAARALNHTKQALSLVNEKMYQICKVVLQNHLALDLLTAQGGVCAMLGTEYSIYIPDHCKNINVALAHRTSEIASHTSANW